MSGPSKNRQVASIVVATLLAAVEARAEAPRLEVPPDVTECPTADELRRAIVNQSGHDDFDRTSAPRVAVRVRRATDTSLAADVSMTTHDGSTRTRTIESAETCGDLVRAAALTIALAMEQDAQAAPEHAAPPAPKVESAPPKKEQVVSLDPPMRADRVVVTASGLTSLGHLPRPSAGAAVSARARVSSSLWLSARGFWLPGASMPNDDFELRLLAAGGGACVEPLGGPNVAVSGCGHVFAGSFDVAHANVGMANQRPEAYVAASLSAGIRARLYGPFHFEGIADAHLPFVRPTYLTTTCPPRGFEPPFAALAIWLGVGMSFR